MEEKIRARIAQLKAERDTAARELQQHANLMLAPYNAAIQELEALLVGEPQPPEQPAEEQ